MSRQFPSQDAYDRELAQKAQIRSWIVRSVITVIVLFFLLVVGCNTVKRVKTEAGHETVLIEQPIFFGKGGVLKETLKPGSAWVWRSTKTVPVFMNPFTVPVIIDDFSSKDNYLLDFESAVTMQVTDASYMIKNFGEGWWKSSLDRPYKTAVRAQVREHDMSALMANQVIVKQVDEKLTTATIQAVNAAMLRVRIIDVNLGRAKPATEVLNEMNRTASQTQRRLTLVQSELAEQARKKEQEAKADADNAYRNKIGLNAEEFVRLQLADKTVDACRVAKECVLVPQGTSVVR